MKFNFKKSICVCASALMMLGLVAPAANAASTASKNSNTAKTARIAKNNATHQSNETKINNLKKTHENNVKKFNRIKQHIQNHQKNLQKIATRMKKAKGKNTKRHHNTKDVALINKLNSDKSKLINAIKYNQRGMLRLAKNVKSEEHQISLIKHPTDNPAITSKHQNNSKMSNNNKPHYHLVRKYYHVHIVRHGNHWPASKVKRSSRSYHIDNHNGKIMGTAVINGKSYPLTKAEYQQAQDQMNNFKLLSRKINNYTHQVNHELKADFRI